MKKLMKRVVLTLIITLLVVTPFIKADSVVGADVVSIAVKNMVNIRVVDQFGNNINSGKITMKNKNGEYAKINLATGELTTKAPGVSKMGQGFTIYATDLQRFVSSGTVVGVSAPNINNATHDYTNMVLEGGSNSVRIWYVPDRTDYVLKANTGGVYVDPKWKNAGAKVKLEIGENLVNINEDTGLTLHPWNDGDELLFMLEYAGQQWSNYSASNETDTEYVKVRMKLSDIDPLYDSDGTYRHLDSGENTKIANTDKNKCAVIFFLSDGMITVPVPDAEGYVEVYVSKKTGTVTTYTKSYREWIHSGKRNLVYGYPYIDMTVQGPAAPSKGYGIMGVEAGKYTIGIEMGADYRNYASPTFEVKNSENIQEIKCTVHKHTYSNWKSDGTNHWKICTCGNKSDNVAHSYKWITDKAATTEAVGSKHQECTICGYKKTAVEIPKLHKHSYGEWKNNAEEHWHECSCGNKQDNAAHSSAREATETTAKVCDKCGYIMAPAIGHINHIADESKYCCDENKHWYQCIGCTLKMEEHNHSFEWIVDQDATEDMMGQKHEECTECGYKKEAIEIPQIIVETEAPTEQDTTIAETESETETQIKVDSKDNNNWIWIIVGIGVFVVATTVVLVILINKKKKKDE